MRSLHLALLGTAMYLLVSACTERSVSGPVDRQSFNFTNGPESPGPIIFRNADEEYRVSYSDPARPDRDSWWGCGGVLQILETPALR